MISRQREVRFDSCGFFFGEDADPLTFDECTVNFLDVSPGDEYSVCLSLAKRRVLPATGRGINRTPHLHSFNPGINDGASTRGKIHRRDLTIRPLRGAFEDTAVDNVPACI